MLRRIWFLAMCLTLILFINTGCDINITGTDDIFIIDQDFVTGTWYAEYEVLNPVDTSYKYYTTTITIDLVTDVDDYPGADDYYYDFSIQKLLYLEIREETQSGSSGITSQGFCHQQQTEYDEDLTYKFTSSSGGGGSVPITFTQTHENPDSLKIQFSGNIYKAGKSAPVKRY